MQNAVMRSHDQHLNVASDSAARLSHAMPGDPLKLLLMDDNTFDRKTITRMARKSRFSLTMIEATSIADAEKKIQSEKPDLVYLDYRVPDGDGISFSARLTKQMNGSAPPVVIITGEGDERTAIRSIRCGVTDYLSKDNLSVELFDGSIERCLAARPVQRTNLAERVNDINADLQALRETTRRNMHMARAFMMPMANYAWQSVTPLTGDDRKAEAKRLMKITQRLIGFLDETLIATADDADGGKRRLIDLHGLVQGLMDSEPEVTEFLHLGDAKRFPNISGNHPQLTMLVRELIGEALASVPPDRKPEVTIDCAIDPQGNPILRVTDNGDCLAGRQRGLKDFVDDVGDTTTALPGHSTRLSLCQKLAEMNGGQLRLTQAKAGGCTVMVRFPRCSVEVQ